VVFGRECKRCRARLTRGCPTLCLPRVRGTSGLTQSCIPFPASHLQKSLDNDLTLVVTYFVSLVLHLALNPPPTSLLGCLIPPNPFRIRTSENEHPTRMLIPSEQRESRELSSQSAFRVNPFRIRTYKKVPSNSFRMRTYKNKGLKVLQNEHLQKNPRGRGLFPPPLPPRSHLLPSCSPLFLTLLPQLLCLPLIRKTTRGWGVFESFHYLVTSLPRCDGRCAII